MNWFIEIIWAWELQPFISEDFLNSCTPPWTRVFPVDDRLPSEDWLCHIDFELTSLHSLGAQGWLGPLSRSFQHLSHFWSTIPTFMIMTLMIFHIRKLHDIAGSFFFYGVEWLNRQPLWYQPWRRVFLTQYIRFGACCLNLRALLLDWHVKTLGKMLHLDSLVHCSRSLPDNFLLHSQRLYRFHKHCFGMDLGCIIRLVCAGRMLSVSSGLTTFAIICRLKCPAVQVETGSSSPARLHFVACWCSWPVKLQGLERCIPAYHICRCV